MPPAVVSSASIGRRTTLSPKGISFILQFTPCSAEGRTAHL
jgi:hypothetical protein